MKTSTFLKTMALAGLMLLTSAGWGQEIFFTNFNEESSWNNPGGSWTSYNQKTYDEGGWFFNAEFSIRDTDVTYSSSAYSLRNRGDLTITCTDGVSDMTGFKVFMRDWRSTPKATRDILISYDAGVNWTLVGSIDGSFFPDEDNFYPFEYDFPGGEQSFDPNDFKIILQGANNNNNRLRIGGFSVLGITSGNIPPSISNISQSPDTDITSTTTVGVSADISVGDAPIESVKLKWGTTSGVYPNEIDMVIPLMAGVTYTTETDIPGQPDGTTVYYIIYAEDEDEESATSPQQSYTVRDPRFTTLPYEETFDTDLGDCYVYSVSGDTKFWIWNSGGWAEMNGFNSGDIEEDWLILPGINLDNYEDEVMTFESWKRFNSDDEDNYLKLLYSTDYAGVGDPSSATWSELTFEQPADEQVWTSSGNIDLSGISGTEVWIAFKYRYEPGNYRRWQIDNILIQEVDVEDPDSFTATTQGPFEIELAFETNAAEDDVVIVFNDTGVFDEPSGAPPAAEEPFAGGTLLYMGTVSPQTHSGLDPANTYYYKAWSYDGANYSPGLTANAQTFSLEPSNHPLDFMATVTSFNSITVSWEDSDADAYLIKGSTIGFEDIADPVDGVPEGDGGLVKNVLAGVESHEFTGLDPDTERFFKIFPYNGSGPTVNYKTDGIVPEASATTLAMPDVITQWDFNASNLTPNVGSGTAANVGGTSTTFAGGVTGQGWNTAAYPGQGTGSGTAGVEFMVSTAGYEDIMVSFYHRASGTASRWAQIQYTVDGGDTWDVLENNNGALSLHDTFYPFEFDFTGVPEVNNNPLFGIRILSIFSPVAFSDGLGNDYGPNEAYHRARVSGGSPYGPSGTWRFDDVTFLGYAIPPDVPEKLAIIDINDNNPVTANVPFSITVQALDENDIPANVTEDTEITLTLETGTGSLSGTLVATILENENSVTFTNVIYDTGETGVSLTASATDGMVLDPGTSALFEVLNPATQLAFVDFPEEGFVNSYLPQFTVEARRPDNSVDPMFTGTITLSVETGTGNLNGTLSKNAVDGVATFNPLYFDQAGTYTLTAEASGLTPDTSDEIEIAPIPDNIIAQWDFDTERVLPSLGLGMAANIGGTITEWADGVTGRGWNTRTYPAQSTASGTAGVEFMVSTVGFENIGMSFWHRASGTASRWAQFEYTTDGGDNWIVLENNNGGISPHDTFYQFELDFSSISEVNNNPDFGVRIVSIFSPFAFDQNATLTYGPDEAYQRANVQSGPPGTGTGTGDYGTGGTWRFDDVTFFVIESEPEVPENRPVTDENLGMDDEACYDATNTITVTNTIIGNGASAEFRAGVSILFGEGFVAEEGSYMLAIITNEYCTIPPALLASEELVIPAEKSAIAHEESMFRAYPNPTTGMLNIEFIGLEGSSKVLAEIYSIMGERLVQYEVSGSGNYRIDMSSMPRGMYILRVIVDGKAETQKIVRQ